MLCIFSAAGSRFALHVEVKQPLDNFSPKKDQAKNYGLRADCWARASPKAVLAHSAADTMLLFSETRRADYLEHIHKFGSSMTFEEITKNFPKVVSLPAS